MNRQMEKLKLLAADAPGVKLGKKAKPRTIVIASGKGGVGKTTLAVNIAVALSDLGVGCGLIDADLSLADAHVLFGHRPVGDLSDVVKKGKDAIQAFNRLPDGPWILPGLNGDAAMASLNERGRNKLIASFARLAHPMRVVLIDGAAGAGPDITDFALWADELILIVVPEPTSILDSYGFLKIYHSQGGRGPVRVIVNRVGPGEEHAGIFGALRSTAQGFLGMDLQDLGAVPEDPSAAQALAARRPIVRLRPRAPASRAIREIAEKLRRHLPNLTSPDIPKGVAADVAGLSPNAGP